MLKEEGGQCLADPRRPSPSPRFILTVPVPRLSGPIQSSTSTNVSSAGEVSASTPITLGGIPITEHHLHSHPASYPSLPFLLIACDRSLEASSPFISSFSYHYFKLKDMVIQASCSHLLTQDALPCNALCSRLNTLFLTSTANTCCRSPKPLPSKLKIVLTPHEDDALSPPLPAPPGTRSILPPSRPAPPGALFRQTDWQDTERGGAWGQSVPVDGVMLALSAAGAQKEEGEGCVRVNTRERGGYNT